MNPINEPRLAMGDRINDVKVGGAHVLTMGEDGSSSFDVPQPSYDEEEFKLMVERGTRAWANVADSAAWVEALRGDDQRGLGRDQSTASEVGDSHD